MTPATVRSAARALDVDPVTVRRWATVWAAPPPRCRPMLLDDIDLMVARAWPHVPHGQRPAAETAIRRTPRRWLLTTPQTTATFPTAEAAARTWAEHPDSAGVLIDLLPTRSAGTAAADGTPAPPPAGAEPSAAPLTSDRAGHRPDVSTP